MIRLKTPNVCLLILAVFGTVWAKVTTFSAPSGVPVSDRFKVRVDGMPVDVYAARVSVPQKYASWPAPLETKNVGFVIFDMNAPASLKVEVLGEAPRSAKIRPLSKSFPVSLQGAEVELRLEKPGNVILELNGDNLDHLYLFANAPEKRKIDPKDPNVIYFGPGIHHPKKIIPERDNMTIYLAGGAVVKGAIYPLKVSNLTIAGRGILEGDFPERWYMVNPRNCAGFTLEDIVILNSPSWTVRMENSKDIKIRNLREISYRQNCDGIDPYSCENVDIDGVFIRNFDDGVVVKAMSNGASRNIFTRRSIFISDYGTALKVGRNETLGSPISDIFFKDCDVISCGSDLGTGYDPTALGVFFNGPSQVSNVVFENIRVEKSGVEERSTILGSRFIFSWIANDNAYLKNVNPGSLRGV
ncbi:MAG: hypothetical protein JNM63_19120, partial [Spirochaetia bacterium]|nr:hypothetical protein [Spirochaetia bacterium]